MSDPIKTFLQNNGLEQAHFSDNSRYQGLPIATWTRPDGQIVHYVTRRFIPAAEHFTPLQEHMVQENDRLDNIAARYFSDPQLYWRLCDANNAMNPLDLTREVGRRLRITLPQDIPASE